jgi:ABC-type multidrug transport system ATPase subunit
MNAAIEIEGLTKRYSEIEAVAGLSFQVAPGG